MNNKLSWRDALKQFNDNRVKEGGKYTIPKKGTPEYASVRKLMGDDVDAVPLQPDKTITGQNAPGKKALENQGNHLKVERQRKNKNCQLKKNHYGMTIQNLLRKQPN